MQLFGIVRRCKNTAGQSGLCLTHEAAKDNGRYIWMPDWEDDRWRYAENKDDLVDFLEGTAELSFEEAVKRLGF